MPKKIDCFIRLTTRGEKLIMKAQGERIFVDEDEGEMERVLLVHIDSDEYKIHHWSVINEYTGLTVCSGDTRKKCLIEWEEKKQAYYKCLLNRVEMFRKSHEELQKLTSL